VSQHYTFMVPAAAPLAKDRARNAEHTLIFGLGPTGAHGACQSDADLAAALDALEDASLRKCGGFTLHRGKGGWIDPDGRIVKEDVIILMVAATYASVRELAAIGKKLFGPTAIYVKKPDGSTLLL